jgi:hypothetical protein
MYTPFLSRREEPEENARLFPYKQILQNSGQTQNILHTQNQPIFNPAGI